MKWMNWHEWHGMNELKWTNWDERIEIKEWKRMNCQQCSETISFLGVCAQSTTWWLFFDMKSSSHYSLVHILSTSSSKSGPALTAFYYLFSEMATVSCTFCQPHLPRVVWVSSFLRSLCEIELSLQSRAHFCWLSPIEAKQRPSSGDHGRPLSPKKTVGFRARECFQAWIHAFPFAQLLDDDAVDKMMWLTWWLRWWCECHYGDTASHDNRPQLGSFLTKLPLTIHFTSKRGKSPQVALSH